MSFRKSLEDALNSSFSDWDLDISDDMWPTPVVAGAKADSSGSIIRCYSANVARGRTTSCLQRNPFPVPQ